MTPVSVNDTARVTTRRRVPASSAMRAARTATLGIGLVLVLAACATVEKTAARDPINSSEHAIFNIEVGVLQEGPENQPAQDVTLTDDLPDGQLWAVTGDAGALAGCEVDEGTLAASSGTLTCDFEEIPYDETVALAITAVTDGTDCGEIENEAQVSQILPVTGAG